MKEMIENDIDLLEDEQLKDSYFLCIRLLSLIKSKKKSKRKHCGHFKFLIEQDNNIIDQTSVIEDVFYIMKTHSISLNKQSLYFIVPDLNNSNTIFEMKMYRGSENSVQELANLQIATLTYIDLFLEEGKNVFNQTIALCPQYSLQYQIYVEKTKIQLDNLLVSGHKDVINGAFKKKVSEFIQIENQKVEILKKNSLQNSSNVLRKSLKFNSKQPLTIKDKKTQKSIIPKPQKQNLKNSSFFSKIETKINRKYVSNIGNIFVDRKLLLVKFIVTFVLVGILFYLMLIPLKKQVSQNG